MKIAFSPSHNAGILLSLTRRKRGRSSSASWPGTRQRPPHTSQPSWTQSGDPSPASRNPSQREALLHKTAHPLCHSDTLLMPTPTVTLITSRHETPPAPCADFWCVRVLHTANTARAVLRIYIYIYYPGDKSTMITTITKTRKSKIGVQEER